MNGTSWSVICSGITAKCKLDRSVVAVMSGITGRGVGVRVPVGEGVGGAVCVGNTGVAVDGSAVASVEAFPHPDKRTKMDKVNVITLFMCEVLSSPCGF